jgi:hypothetical protein
MSFLNVAPEMMSAAAEDLANIGTMLSEASDAAALPTTSVAAAGADEVSAGIAALFSAHGQAFQGLSAQAALFHEQFVQLVHGGAAQYLSTEVENAEQNALKAINAPTEALVHRPLVGNGANGTSADPNGGGLRPAEWCTSRT